MTAAYSSSNFDVAEIVLSNSCLYVTPSQINQNAPASNQNVNRLPAASITSHHCPDSSISKIEEPTF